MQRLKTSCRLFHLVNDERETKCINLSPWAKKLDLLCRDLSRRSAMGIYRISLAWALAFEHFFFFFFLCFLYRSRTQPPKLYISSYLRPSSVAYGVCLSPRPPGVMHWHHMYTRMAVMWWSLPCLASYLAASRPRPAPRAARLALGWSQLWFLLRAL